MTRRVSRAQIDVLQEVAVDGGAGENWVRRAALKGDASSVGIGDIVMADGVVAPAKIVLEGGEVAVTGPWASQVARVLLEGRCSSR